MATACPNKNSKEWKTLVSQTGETLATLAFIANGYRIPEVKPVTEIKKAIGFKPRVENFAGVAAKLRKFNQQNGTSHYFTFTKAWGNTFELTLKYNYLPVNIEKQRQRKAAQGDPLYVVDDFNDAGFRQVYPSMGSSSNIQNQINFQTDDLITEGVEELFNSNPELANQVYETLGFNKLITPNDKIVFGHPTIGKSYLKKQGEDKFISLDDDYAGEINIRVNQIADKYDVTSYQVKDGGTQKWNNEYNQMMQEMFDVAKQKAISENKTLFTSNTNLLRTNAASFDKIINLSTAEFEKRIQERGAKYDVKEWKSQINEVISKLPTNKVINTDKYLSDLFITPQQKQQALQQYSQYLDSIFPDSQVKDIVYHGTASSEKIEKLRTQNDRIYFSDKTTASRYASWDQDNRQQFEPGAPTKLQVISAVINLQNPILLNNVSFKETETDKRGDGIIGTNIIDPLGGIENQIVVRDASQAIVLGSKEDLKGFKNFIATKQTPLETSRQTSLNPNVTAKDDLQNFSDVDDLIDDANIQVTRAEQKRLDKINTAIIKERQALKRTTDPSEYRKILTRLEKLKNLSEDAEGNVIRSKNITAFEDVLDFGDTQLKEVKALLSNNAISYDDIYYAQRIVDLWAKAGDFSTEASEHIFLDEDEFNSDEIRAAFRALKNNSEDLQGRINKLRENYVGDFIRQYTDKNLTQEEIFKAIKDINKISGLTLNLSRHDDAMLQGIFAAVERANMEAQQEAAEVWKTLDSLHEKFLKKAGGNFNILKQVTEDGKETGRMVHRFSPKFFEIRNRMLYEAFKQRDTSGKLKKDKKKVEDYFNWVNRNTISFDPRILFADSVLDDGTMPDSFLYTRVKFTEGAREEHIRDLKYHLGEKGYNYFIKKVEDKVEQFKIRREAIYESMQLEPNLSQAEKDALFETWLKENSPYWGMDMAQNPATRIKGKENGKDVFYTPKGVRDSVIQVPRKEVDGATTEWYDQNFAKIEVDEDLLNYYNFTIQTLNSLRYMLPQQKQALLGVGVLPSIQKNLMDIFQEKGMMIGITPFWDKMKDLVTTTDFATTIYSDINPLTGNIEKNIQVQYVEDTENRVRDMVKTMSIEHKQRTGKPATELERREFKKEARDIISKEKSWDVTKILKAYSLTVLAYKHKSFIEPQIKLAEQELKSRKELVVNKAGQAQMQDGKPVVEEGLANLKSSFDFFMDSTFYGVGGRKVEGLTKKKVYKKEEEVEKKKLEELLENEEDPATREFLQAQINSLGGYVTGSGIGDTALKYMTIKGLGWNVFSGVSNMGFGLISNLIQASDGREYSMQNFRKASMLVMNSIGRNLSFNTWEGVNGNAVKIRTLMDKWDLLQTSNKEMFDVSQKSSLSKLKRFGPFSIQERSEYLNYAPIMIAVMLEFPAKDSNGNTVTMWDAYDTATGKLKEGFTTDVDEVKMFQKIKRVIEMNHGDYNNALQVKATFAGRALSQFRTWMFEGFANRFETEKADYALSYGLDEPYIRKGRYRSYTKGQLVTTGGAVGTMFLPGVGTALGAGIGYIAGRLGGLDTQDSAISDTLFTLKQLARKLMFQKTEFEKKFDAVDAANMRKNMTELYIMITLMGVALMLKSLVDDEDEKDSMVTNFILNQTIRLRTDIAFYTNPLEFEKLTKTAVPLAQVVQDAYRVVEDIGKLFNEDASDDVFESGPFKGTPKWLVHTGQMIPGPSQGIRLYKTGQRVMD
jgi:hypothetical protein